MKTLFLALVVLWTTVSFGYDVKLLTPEQIKSLTKGEQLHYMRGVQRILAGMVQQTPFMAKWLEKNGRLPANDDEFQKAYEEYIAQQAGTTTVGSPAVINKLRAEGSPQAPAPQEPASSAKSTPVSDTREKVDPKPIPPMESKPTSSTPSPSTPTTATPTTAEPKKNTKSKAVKKEGAVVELVDEEASAEDLKTMFPNEKTKRSSSKSDSSKSSKTTPPKPTAQSNPKVDDPSLLDSQESYDNSPSKPTPPAADKKEQKQTSSQPQEEKKADDKSQAKEEKKSAEDTGDRKHFRCMYSGWVVEGPDCTGPQKIQAWLAFDGMKEQNKSCPSGSVVCMPLIFGLHLPEQCKSFQQEGCAEQAKPLCAKRGAWPTVDCYKMAGDNKSRATRVALELITEIAPEQYARYQGLFKDLCDEDQIKSNPFADKHKGHARSKVQAKRIRDDITKTCEWASKQMADLNSMQNIDKLLGQEKKAAPEKRDPRSKARR